jgi:hypothetical protein
MVAVNRGLPVTTDQIESTDLADLPCILLGTDPQPAPSEEAYYREILGVQSDFVGPDLR